MVKSGKPGFYAVARGRTPGVYNSWDDCQAQTAGFPGNKHQKFPTYDQARKYLAEHGVFIGSSNVSSSSSSTPSSSHSLQHGPAARGRVHGSKPYARVKPPSTPTTSVQEPSRSNSRWAALASEVIQDESGWDVVYSDGACKGNGKVGSVAGVGVWWGDNDARNIAERCPGAQTNNRAELIAIVRVLETTPHTKRPLLIKTDSKYSISCFRHWMPKWLQNNFRTASGEPVKNAPLIRYLSMLLDERARQGQKVHLQYIQGHAGHEGNEGADRLANLGVMLPAEPERDWAALMDSVSATPSQGGEVAAAASSSASATAMSQSELEAYAAGLGDDDDILRELAGS